MPTKPVAKKPSQGKGQVIRPVQKKAVQKKAAPTQKKAAYDNVEVLVREYLVELREVEATFEKGAAVVEKYRAKYPELASYILFRAPASFKTQSTLANSFGVSQYRTE